MGNNNVPKIIIEIENGTIIGLSSTIDVEYVVIDYDKDSEEPILIGLPNKPDIVSETLSLTEVISTDKAEFINDPQVTGHWWK